MGNSLRAKLIPPRPGCDATSFSDWCKRMTVQAVQAAEAAEAKAMEVCLCVCVSAGAFHFRQSAARSQSCPVPLALLVYLSTLSSVSDGIATVLLPHACFLRRALRLAPTAPLHGPRCGHGRPGRRLDRHTARHDPRIASTERVVSWAQADTTYKASVHTTSYCHWVYLRKQPCVYQRPAACPPIISTMQCAWPWIIAAINTAAIHISLYARGALPLRLSTAKELRLTWPQPHSQLNLSNQS
jgi:hypothetical protein